MGFLDKLFKLKKNNEEVKVEGEVNDSIETQINEAEENQDSNKEIEIQPQDEINESSITEVQDVLEESNIVEEENLNNDVEYDLNDAEKKKGFFTKLKEGLNKTRKNIIDSIDRVLGSFTKIDEELFEELEESLIMADIGVETTDRIVNSLREHVKRERVTEPIQIKQILIDEITQILEEGETKLDMPSPVIILVIGVNGVGKTTSIGKLANKYKNEGKKVLLAAADTFRAAAIDQLEIWGQRSNIDVIKHQENSDPAAVVYDAIQAAKSRKVDILICDTAGRLHNKKNLMEELRKISKIINREYPDAHKETFLVIDGTTGQNALQQVKVFKEITEITGIIITKLDGTAKGGIIIAIKSELKIPVRYIGVGEKIEDLQEFNASDFSKALFQE